MSPEPVLWLKLPASVTSFVTIKLPVLCPAETEASQANADLLRVDKQTLRMHQLWHALNTLQPGGPFIAFPCSATECQVICHKAVVGAVFKGLKAQQSQLNFKMPDVKSCVSLAPLSTAELQTAFELAIQARLGAVEWSSIGQQHMVQKNLCNLDAASIHRVQSLRLSVSSVAPDKVAIRLETGTMTIRPFSLQKCLPSEHRHLMAEVDVGQSLQCAILLLAANQAVDGLPCALLPEGRPAIMSHVSRSTSDETNLRNWWLVNTSVQLPAHIGYFVHVRLEDDYDAPTVPYPSCCVLAPGGMSYSAHKPGSDGQVQMLKTVTGILSQPLPFWKGTAAILMRQITLSASPPCKPTKPVSEHEHHATWATAAERQSEMHSLPQQTPTTCCNVTTGASIMTDLLPAAEVLAAFQVSSDASTPAFQRRRWPKVQVSESLQALLSTVTHNQTNMTTPDTGRRQSALKSAHATAKAAPGSTETLSRIIFNKRVQPTSAMAKAAAIETAEQTAAGPVPAVAQPLQPAKRPADTPASAMVPTFAKRPKLAGSGKAPSSSKPAVAGSKAVATGSKAAAASTKLHAGVKKKTATKTSALSKAITPANTLAAAPAASTAAAANLTPMVTPEAVTAGAAATVIPGTAAADVVAAASMTVSAAAHAACQAAVAPAAESAAVIGPATVAAPAAPVKAPRQRKKADDIDSAAVERKVLEKHAAGSLSDLSIPELKCVLKARKATVGGKKADLIARLQSLLDAA